MKKSILIPFLLVISLTQVSFSGDDNDLFRFKLKEDKSVLFRQNNSQSLFAGSYKFIKIDSVKPKKKYKVDPMKITILGVTGAGVFTAMHIYYSNTWWKDQKNFFKYAEDGYYARNVDRASHIFTASFFTEATAAAYEWTGIRPEKALLYGAITSMAYETYIEINDGFAPNWGFDWVDMGANVFGVVYPFFQRLLPPLENVNFKWSFNPKWLERKVTKTNDLLDDYTNMTFWLSVNPELFLPGSVTKGKLYPNFLAIALGMSIKNASHAFGSQNAYEEWFLAFDIDLKKLPGKSDFLVKLKRLLNFYHFPTPAVRFSPSGIWYGLYF